MRAPSRQRLFAELNLSGYFLIHDRNGENSDAVPVTEILVTIGASPLPSAVRLHNHPLPTQSFAKKREEHSAGFGGDLGIIRSTGDPLISVQIPGVVRANDAIVISHRITTGVSESGSAGKKANGDDRKPTFHIISNHDFFDL